MGDIVGVSLDAKFNLRAFLRHNGVMTDLNTLIPAGTPLTLMLACSINSSGEITGLAMTSAGEFHGYVATPSSESLAAAAQGAIGPMVLSEDARTLLQQRLRFVRFGAGFPVSR